MRSLGLFFLCSLVLSCAHSHANKDASFSVSLITEFQGNRCERVLPSLLNHLKQYKIDYKKLKGKGRCGVRIVPGKASPLNRFAADLAAVADTAVVYDLGYFATHPNAVAAYIPPARELMLPYDVVLSGNPQHWALLHELDQVETDVLKRDGHWSPHHGVLSGEAFKPEPLDLDEMRVYANDMGRAERALARMLESDDALKIFLKLDRRAMLDARKQGPVARVEDPTAALWDRLLAANIHGQRHTQPAVIALEAVVDSLKYGKEAKMRLVGSVYHFTIGSSADFGQGASYFTLALEMSDLPIQSDWDPSPLLQTRTTTMLQTAKGIAKKFNDASMLIEKLADAHDAKTVRSLFESFL